MNRASCILMRSPGRLSSKGVQRCPRQAAIRAGRPLYCFVQKTDLPLPWIHTEGGKAPTGEEPAVTVLQPRRSSGWGVMLVPAWRLPGPEKQSPQTELHRATNFQGQHLPENHGRGGGRKVCRDLTGDCQDLKIFKRQM